MAMMRGKLRDYRQKRKSLDRETELEAIAQYVADNSVRLLPAWEMDLDITPEGIRTGPRARARQIKRGAE